MTRKRILAAATVEFARKGLGGARVDEIALRSKSNKRMIYHYFGSKEQLFKAVLEAAYLGIRTAEQNASSRRTRARRRNRQRWSLHLEILSRSP